MSIMFEAIQGECSTSSTPAISTAASSRLDSTIANARRRLTVSTFHRDHKLDFSPPKLLSTLLNFIKLLRRPAGLLPIFLNVLDSAPQEGTGLAGCARSTEFRIQLRLRTAGLLLALPLLLTPALARQKRGPSTAEERATAVKGARLLESDPFNKDAKKTRAWFTLWLIQVPDISIEVCPAYLKPLYDAKGKNYSTEIATQMMFSSAAFVIEHPDQAQDRIAVNTAGLEGALKTYESIIKEKPKARWDFLDGLIARRDKGELPPYVQDVSDTDCKSKQ